jgi:hypothetical protein
VVSFREFHSHVIHFWEMFCETSCYAPLHSSSVSGDGLRVEIGGCETLLYLHHKAMPPFFHWNVFSVTQGLETMEVIVDGSQHRERWKWNLNILSVILHLVVARNRPRIVRGVSDESHARFLHQKLLWFLSDRVCLQRSEEEKQTRTGINPFKAQWLL